ncbi:uncharacterized protein IL334_007839 [Kwoniella shivajii]|uniref:Vacuolar protein sorting-associated protein 51 homolog n=1 Tax=Kwoniella shivajii TaxID=564305 RepID=A0ABZ1D9R3_9TREE|nr:hypothetical protein IL334_007839 [Kwoniella shivajii]
MASSTPIVRRHSEMPSRQTPQRKISTFTDSGQQSSPAEMKRGNSSINVERSRARREQLRNFYGIKEGATEVSGSGVRGDPLDIDSPSFSPTAYYEDLVSKSTLKGLMEKSTSLNADIGNLEGSRHSLVYNHHHQLFAAGDTISHLNSRTPQLLSIVTELQQSFSSISQLVDSISLPENDKGPIPSRKDNSLTLNEVERGKDRVELMILAQDSHENIRKYFETLKDKMVAEVGTSNPKEYEKISGLLDEIKRRIDDLPVSEEATA